MRRFVLDTNILLAYVRENPVFNMAEKMCQLTAPDASLLVSVVTLAELRVLAQANHWGEKKQKQLANFLSSLILIDISSTDEYLLEAYTNIDCYSRAPESGSARTMGKNDIWIAATAAVTNATLVTTDVDFDHLSGQMLKVVKIPV